MKIFFHFSPLFIKTSAQRWKSLLVVLANQRQKNMNVSGFLALILAALPFVSAERPDFSLHNATTWKKTGEGLLDRVATEKKLAEQSARESRVIITDVFARVAGRFGSNTKNLFTMQLSSLIAACDTYLDCPSYYDCYDVENGQVRPHTRIYSPSCETFPLNTPPCPL